MTESSSNQVNSNLKSIGRASIGTKESFWNRKKVNIEASAACLLKCNKCGRQTDPTFPERKKLFETLQFSEFKKLAAYFDDLSFCGGYSDPVMSNYIIEYLEYAHSINKRTIIHTAVSHRPMEWYEETFKRGPSTRWIFGIDGLPKDSHKYRVGQDGEKLFEVAKLAASMGIDTHWQYIIFKYNENDIEQAAKMAEDAGIVFTVVKSTRWDKPFDPLKPSDEFLNKHYEGRMGQKKNYLQPRCFGATRWFYSGEGFLLPCCYLNRDGLYKRMGLDAEKFKLKHFDSVEDIIHNDWYNDFAGIMEVESNPETADRSETKAPYRCWNVCRATDVRYDKLLRFEESNL